MVLFYASGPLKLPELFKKNFKYILLNNNSHDSVEAMHILKKLILKNFQKVWVLKNFTQLIKKKLKKKLKVF